MPASRHGAAALTLMTVMLAMSAAGARAESGAGAAGVVNAEGGGAKASSSSTAPPVTTATTTTTTTTTTVPGSSGALTMTVLANGEPAGAAPGPSIAAGSAVAWTYAVTNSGTGTFWSLYLWHDGVGRADCPDRTLVPGETVR